MVQSMAVYSLVSLQLEGPIVFEAADTNFFTLYTQAWEKFQRGDLPGRDFVIHPIATAGIGGHEEGLFYHVTQLDPNQLGTEVYLIYDSCPYSNHRLVVSYDRENALHRLSKTTGTTSRAYWYKRVDDPRQWPGSLELHGFLEIHRYTLDQLLGFVTLYQEVLVTGSKRYIPGPGEDPGEFEAQLPGTLQRIGEAEEREKARLADRETQRQADDNKKKQDVIEQLSQLSLNELEMIRRAVESKRLHEMYLESQRRHCHRNNDE
jgi:hypothetical protein